MKKTSRSESHASRSPLGFRNASCTCLTCCDLRSAHACAENQNMCRSQHARSCVAIAMWAQIVTSFLSQREMAADTKAKITAKMKLESSLLHIGSYSRSRKAVQNRSFFSAPVCNVRFGIHAQVANCAICGREVFLRSQERAWPKGK